MVNLPLAATLFSSIAVCCRKNLGNLANIRETVDKQYKTKLFRTSMSYAPPRCAHLSDASNALNCVNLSLLNFEPADKTATEKRQVTGHNIQADCRKLHVVNQHDDVCYAVAVATLIVNTPTLCKTVGVHFEHYFKSLFPQRYGAPLMARCSNILPPFNVLATYVDRIKYNLFCPNPFENKGGDARRFLEAFISNTPVLNTNTRIIELETIGRYSGQDGIVNCICEHLKRLDSTSPPVCTENALVLLTLDATYDSSLSFEESWRGCGTVNEALAHVRAMCEKFRSDSHLTIEGGVIDVNTLYQVGHTVTFIVQGIDICLCDKGVCREFTQCYTQNFLPDTRVTRIVVVMRYKQTRPHIPNQLELVLPPITHSIFVNDEGMLHGVLEFENNGTFINFHDQLSYNTDDDDIKALLLQRNSLAKLRALYANIASLFKKRVYEINDNCHKIIEVDLLGSRYYMQYHMCLKLPNIDQMHEIQRAGHSHIQELFASVNWSDLTSKMPQNIIANFDVKVDATHVRNSPFEEPALQLVVRFKKKHTLI